MLFMTTQQSNPPATPHRGVLRGCGLDGRLQQPQRSETGGGGFRQEEAPPKRRKGERKKKAKKKRRCRWWLVVVEVEEMLTFWHYS